VRVGFGVDTHRLTDEGGVLLGGILVDRSQGVAATSDGDVLAHAVCDALLGAAALGDMGSHFPSDDAEWEGADSIGLLGAAVELVRRAGWAPASVDATVVAESIRVAPHREEIRASLADALGIPVSAVSVKATTTDGLGFTGSGEGIMAMAVAVLGEG
jgi:2-C-methyl-D-erythritol 2,4-cyclodiphosphate synthase